MGEDYEDERDEVRAKPVARGNSSFLEGLGTHFHESVAAHKQKQQDELSQSIALRVRNIDELAEILAPLLTDERSYQVSRTPRFEVETLETGPKVSAYLVGHVEGRIENQSIGSAAHHLVTKTHGNFGYEYVQRGAHSDPVTLAKLGLDAPFGKDSDVVFLDKGAGISVWATLETPHQYDDGKIEDSVFVGTIIDPESILVPEPKSRGQQQLFSVIGPQDSRFIPIMQMLEHVMKATAYIHAPGPKIVGSRRTRRPL